MNYRTDGKIKLSDRFKIVSVLGLSRTMYLEFCFPGATKSNCPLQLMRNVLYILLHSIMYIEEVLKITASGKTEPLPPPLP